MKWRDPDDTVVDILTDALLSLFALAFMLMMPVALGVAIWHWMS